MAGHAGNVVVENNGNDAALVVENFGGAGHAAVEEGGVAQNAEDLFLLAGGLKGLGHAHCQREAAAHADAGVHRRQRSAGPQGVTADVTGDDEILSFGHGVEEAPVRAAGTKGGRTGDRFYRKLFDRGLLSKEHLPQTLGVELIHVADQGFADTVNAGGLDLLLHEALQLLNDIEFLHPGGKIADQIHGQGIGEAELQEGGVLGEDIFGILIGNGGRDDTRFRPLQLHAVQRGTIAVFLQGGKVLFHLGMVPIGICRSADIFLRVALIGIRLGFLPLAEGHEALGMGNARRGAKQHRHVKLFRDPVSFLHEVDAFLGVGGLYQGDLGGAGIAAVVLLVLGGVHAGVVCRDDHEAAVDAVVGRGKQRIGGHVQTDVLHCAEAAHPADGSAVGDLGGDLFIRRPFAVQGVLILGQRFKNLRTGSAGICRTDLDPGLVGASGDGFVAGKQMLGH